MNEEINIDSCSVVAVVRGGGLKRKNIFVCVAVMVVYIYVCALCAAFSGFLYGYEVG